MFDSTYFNLGGFHLLRTAGRDYRLATDDSKYPAADVASRLWRPDPSEDDVLLVVRVWSHDGGFCRHTVMDMASGVIVADGLDRTESGSWAQVIERLSRTTYLA